MSLTSTSSDSEQVSLEDFLDSCRPPTLLAELDDDEDMGDEDDNDEDENEDDADYEEVMVSRNLLSFMEEEGYEARPSKRRSWDDEYVLKRQFSALIPAFDPRPGRTNVNQTTGRNLFLMHFDFYLFLLVLWGTNLFKQYMLLLKIWRFHLQDRKSRYQVPNMNYYLNPSCNWYCAGQICLAFQMSKSN